MLAALIERRLAGGNEVPGQACGRTVYDALAVRRAFLRSAKQIIRAGHDGHDQIVGNAWHNEDRLQSTPLPAQSDLADAVAGLTAILLSRSPIAVSPKRRVFQARP